MKRTVLLTVLLLTATGGMAVLQHVLQDRRYWQLLDEGERALRQGQAYVAIEAFSGALALRPTSMVARYRRGEAYRAERQDGSAIRDLREAARLAPEAPQPLIALGELYDLRGDPARAAEWYSQAADRQNADPGLLYSLALARYRAGNPAAAKAPLRQALARNDSAAQAHYLLGLALRDTGDADGAVASLEQAVRLAPGLLQAREELADLYRAEGKSESGLNQLKVLATLDPQINRRLALGLAELEAGHLDSALATLSAVGVDARDNSRVQLAIGRAHLAQAERTGTPEAATPALEVLERALGGTARRSEGLALFGRALHLAGELPRAERLLREAVATSPVAPEAFAYLADTAERLSHPTMARDALLSLDALEGNTASPRVRSDRARRIGELSLAAGDWARAADYLDRAIGGGHASARTYGLLAQARWQAGDADGARAALERGLALDPLDPQLRQFSRTID